MMFTIQRKSVNLHIIEYFILRSVLYITYEQHKAYITYIKHVKFKKYAGALVS